MKAGIKTLLVLGLSALVIGGGTAAAGADSGSDSAAKRADCGPNSLGQARSTFATYVEDLKVKNTSCNKGWKVAKAFHECRKENGGKDGRCKSRVEGYKCDEGKRSGSSSHYRANVVCTKGSKKVKHEYSMSL